MNNDIVDNKTGEVVYREGEFITYETLIAVSKLTVRDLYNPSTYAINLLESMHDMLIFNRMER